MEATRTPKSLLSKKDQALAPRAQIAKLVRIGRRAEARAEWLDTMLGEPTGDRRDPAFGYYANRENATELEAASTRRDRDEANAKADAANAEIGRIAAAHGIRP